MSGRFAGIDVGGYEEALSEVLPRVAREGVDAAVVLVDECPTALEPLFSQHAEWKVSLVVGGHCHRPFHKQVRQALLASPGRGFESYLRATLELLT